MPQLASNIEFSIIICTYNRESFLPIAFNSITKQTLPYDLFEVIIIDNNSTDSTSEICSEFIMAHPSITVGYFTEKQQGLSHARNRGIDEASGEIITFMDDDALLAPDFCEKTLGFFRKHKNVSAIGGKILLQFMEAKPFWYNPSLASLLGYFNSGNREKPFRRSYFRGSNMSFRNELFAKYAPFNTSLGRVGRDLSGSEEKELFFRLRDSGEEIWYVPGAIVYHLVPPERTGLSFIREQGIGAGKSQKKMVMIKGTFSCFLSALNELAKWIVTIILAAFYLIILKPGIAAVLIKFRYWVSCGLFSKIS